MINGKRADTMAKLFVPYCGDLLTLTANWEFTLHWEGRNGAMWKALGVEDEDGDFSWRIHDEVKVAIETLGGRVNRSTQYNHEATLKVSLPEGTVLKVDRVYVRNGNSADFNSLTFRIMECGDPRLVRKRFWARLHDVNAMEIRDEDPETACRERAFKKLKSM
jgi:hypothetical protein